MHSEKQFSLLAPHAALLVMPENSIINKIKKKTYFLGEKVFLCGGDGGGSSCSILGKKNVDKIEKSGNESKKDNFSMPCNMPKLRR